ncbi:heterokaryon incompatibility protein-domain-containing protein [Rhexocercosporidium sp. MPI-PUGE-AT-0058]|nr:heterokaryon incompatibility protein-domain-containing protein [Rhexocercosporidium sp. MPI-PUGE-AT-0058]
MSEGLYKDLNGEREEIRVLELAPGQSCDPIVGTLSTISFKSDPKPSYEALSYVWGDANDTSDISLSGHVVKITQNLEEALLRFRQPHHSRTLWVDAVCINQDDVEERSAQVEMMVQIYAKCTRVIIWLGPAKALDYLAFQVVEALTGNGSKEIHDKVLHSEESVLIPKFHPSCQCADKEDTFHSLNKQCQWYTFALAGLYCKPWWYRSWIVQEATYGRLATFYFGKFEVEAPKLIELHARFFSAIESNMFCPVCVKIGEVSRASGNRLDTEEWLKMSQVNDHPDLQYPTGGSLKDAFWRTVVTNVINDRGKLTYPCPADQEPIFWRAWETPYEMVFPTTETQGVEQSSTEMSGKVLTADKMPTGTSNVLETLTMSGSIATNAKERQFIVLDTGFFANVAPGAQVGDEVWVVRGGRMPLVLRKVGIESDNEGSEEERSDDCAESKKGSESEDGAESDQDSDEGSESEVQATHRLVGDCYIHGIMNGEIPLRNDEDCAIILLE